MPNDYMIAFLHCGLISGLLVGVIEPPHSLQEKKELKSSFLGKTCIFSIGRKNYQIKKPRHTKSNNSFLVNYARVLHFYSPVKCVMTAGSGGTCAFSNYL